MSEYIPQIFLFLSVFYTAFLLYKMYPHVKDDYKVSFWLNLWMVLPESLDEEGKEIRTQLLVLIPSFVVISIVLAKS